MKKNHPTEDYLKCILLLQNRSGFVRAIDIAAEFGVTKASVSASVKKLRALEMIYHDEKGHIFLTDKGRALAEKVSRKHTLITKLLMGIGVDENTASEEACQIEHVIGEETYKRLEEYYERRIFGN